MQRGGRRAAVVGLVVAAGLAGCGGSGSSSSVTAGTGPSTAPASTPPTANGTPLQPSVLPTTVAPAASSSASGGSSASGAACATSQLRVQQTEGQGAAGTEYSGITFTNRSSTTCTLQGYPGVSLLDAQRHQIGQPATRAASSAPVVTLAPGRSATASFSVSPAACSGGLPPRTAYLRVFPPNQRADVVIAAQVLACQPQIRPVHQGAQITP